ncbi:thrombospondin type 3 repeat-containing protein [Granulosicoccus sp. 3-233]|uniref:TolB family protein n=1 Tax=Granulosicoccus sp. 3-233 TaxID=3417969 RepID=UPI003D33228E
MSRSLQQCFTPGLTIGGALFALLGPPSALADPIPYSRLSQDTVGGPGDAASYSIQSGVNHISADGRFVAFYSYASNLHPSDTDSFGDILVFDRDTESLELISTAGGLSPVKGNNNSLHPSISADGRFVAFTSEASNLHPGDTDTTTDIFVFDRDTDSLELISTAGGLSSVKGNDNSLHPSISADGRVVAFHTFASNLHPDDADIRADIFVFDLVTKTLELISTSGGPSPFKGNFDSVEPSISSDGRFVAFRSSATNLHPDDSDTIHDIFVFDRDTESLELISTSGGTLPVKGNSNSYEPSISADGRYVAFRSDASNLHSGDTDTVPDIFVFDRDTDSLELISTAGGLSPVKGNNSSFEPSIGADGRFVAFYSFASNLHPDDSDDFGDIFVFDRDTQSQRLISQPSGESGKNSSFHPNLSPDGEQVLFTSQSTSLVIGGQSTLFQVYLADLSPAASNTAPVADAGPDQILEATSPAGALVMLDGSASFDADSDPLTFDWVGNFGTTAGIQPSVQLPLGIDNIDLSVSDGIETDTDSVLITVQDTTPPTLVVPADITLTSLGPVETLDPGVPSASDLFEPVTISNDAPADYPVDTTTIITWMATDPSGNSTSAFQTVTITKLDTDADGACDPGGLVGNFSNCQGEDNCPTIPNANQANLDGDALGDACDADIDGDALNNELDLCPTTLIPDAAPTRTLRTNRFALTQPGDGSAPVPFTSTSRRQFTTADTGGCSCADILAQPGFASSQQQTYGCTATTLLRWQRAIR